MAEFKTITSSKRAKSKENTPLFSKEKTTLLIVDAGQTKSISIHTWLLNLLRPLAITGVVALVSCLGVILFLVNLSYNKSAQVAQANVDKAQAELMASQMQDQVTELENLTSAALQAKLQALKESEQMVSSLRDYLQERGVNPPEVDPNGSLDDPLLNSTNILDQSKILDPSNPQDTSIQSNGNVINHQTNIYRDDDINHQGGPDIAALRSVPFMGEYADQIASLSEVARQVPMGLPHTGALSSRFGARSNPFGGSSTEFHHGLDFKGVTGEPIRATADGEVIVAGRQNGYGLVVKLQHGYDYVTVYGHLSAINVVNGQKVKAGDVIGELGSTGRSTGPHLHYEVRHNNKPLDPERYLALDALAPNL